MEPFRATLGASITMSLLTTEEYKKTLGPSMINITNTASEIVDLWEYANPIIETEYHNCTAWEWKVSHIYETSDGMFQHIGIKIPIDDTYLTVIVNKPDESIFGHYILDLGKLYGVESDKSA